MNFNEDKRYFSDMVHFTENDPCIWVVYPPGAMGDLLASIINFHYAKTGSTYWGIDERGKVNFQDSNGKKFNLKYLKEDFEINSTIINFVNDHLSTHQTNYSTINQIILSTHSWPTKTVVEILNFFPKSKVIRILPKDSYETNIINWLSMYKNHGVADKFVNKDTPILKTDFIDHLRLLDINLCDLLDKDSFENLYTKLINFLGLDYKLIRYDLIEFYISKQHSIIQPHLSNIFKNQSNG